jgi:adenosylmethionine-8-amino-7-oxononanoate aminotransferase
MRAQRAGLRRVSARAGTRRTVLRPLGDVLYWMPPYCIEEAELQTLATVTASAIDAVQRACA